MAEPAFVANVFGGPNIGTKGAPSTWCDIEQLAERPERPPLPTAPPDPTGTSLAFRAFPHPLEMSLQDICFLYWNVKEFEIEKNLIIEQVQRSVLEAIGTITYTITQETTNIINNYYSFFSGSVKDKIKSRVCDFFFITEIDYRQSATANFVPAAGSGNEPASTTWQNASAPTVLRPNLGEYFVEKPFEPELNRPRIAYFPNPGLNSATQYFYPLDSTLPNPGPRYFCYLGQPLGSDVSTVAPFNRLVGVSVCPDYSFGYAPEDTSWGWTQLGNIQIKFNYSELKITYPKRVPEYYEDTSYFVPIYGATGFNRNAVAFDQDGNPTAWDYFYIDSVSIPQNMIIKISELTSLT